MTARRKAPARPRHRSVRRTSRARRTTARRASSPVLATPDTSGLAPGMQSVNVYLAVANVAASMAFLEKAFGFTRGVVLPDAADQLRYAEMRHGDVVVMLIRKGDATAATSGVAAMYTYVPDVDRALARARDAGAGVG